MIVNTSPKPRLLIFIVAYYAQSTLADVLARIPLALSELVEVAILVIDDGSTDQTFEIGEAIAAKGDIPFPIQVLFNPQNQGYGKNQQIGYEYAITHQFDFVALLHGDGQYAPECLPALIAPLLAGEADAVFGTRMQNGAQALRGGMPLYKFVGNKILTWLENNLLGCNLSEFHSGYRIYATSALKKIPFGLNTADFHFDTEIIIQLLFAKQRIVELPIPTYYGDEICRVNGMLYAGNVLLAVIKARLQSLGIFYAPNFDCQYEDHEQYQLKLDYQSPHSEVLKCIPKGSKVLDLGCAGGYVGELLKKEKGCYVVGVDFFPLSSHITLDEFYQCDLNGSLPEISWADFDYVLLLDIIEHLHHPENFLQALYQKLQLNQAVQILASTGNVAFVITRCMLFLGYFNYGKRGILDLTHTRLFTRASFLRLFLHAGFKVDQIKGIVAPFPLAFGKNGLSKLCLKMNAMAIRLSQGLFSYQLFLHARNTPAVPYLLDQALLASEKRRQANLLKSTQESAQD